MDLIQNKRKWSDTSTMFIIMYVTKFYPDMFEEASGKERGHVIGTTSMPLCMREMF